MIVVTRILYLVIVIFCCGSQHSPIDYHVARADHGELLYILTDHLGTPKEMVEEAGRIRWAADHDTWGTVRGCRTWRSTKAQPNEGYVLTSKGDIGNAALARQVDPDPLFCPIRFQGQWEDEETGLYYNRFRYYEPMTGCFYSADPLGIYGGTRPDAYVIWPHLLSDPFGLTPCCAARYRRCRPSFRQGVVDEVWDTAVKEARSQGLDYILDVGGRRIPVDSWKPGDSRVGVWDMGHLEGKEYWRELERLNAGEITAAEFRDIYNNPNNYRVEHPTTNRSHEFELPKCEN